jgi:hypothetical protein
MIRHSKKEKGNSVKTMFADSIGPPIKKEGKANKPQRGGK